LSRQVTKSYWRQPPTREAVEKLLDSCPSAGSKLAVALAAFSGLGPGQVKKLVFQNLVEYSLVKRRFVEVPSRIQIVELPGIRNRQSAIMKYSTFLSSRGCGWVLEDSKSRSQPLQVGSPVIMEQAFKEAEEAVHAAGIRWHDLRDYFYASCMKVGVSQHVIDFMLGHVTRRDHVRETLSREIDYLRKEYRKVDEQL
jgi:hypothetical protein